jgi:hypothetical protein
VNTATAPAWRLDFDGAELSWARAVPGGWQLRFAVVPARPLTAPAPAAETAAAHTIGHALGVLLHLQAAMAAADAEPLPSTADLAHLVGRCSGLQAWAGPTTSGAQATPLPPLTLPSQHTSPVHLRLQMAQGEVLQLAGQHLQLLQPDGPRWVEHLHC